MVSAHFEDDFNSSELDRSVWLPHYLPAWSSRAATLATYEIRGSCLYLSIPPEQGLWCEEDHRPRLRVSAVQSGNFSGPVGSTLGQQPFADGLAVNEEQESFWGWTPRLGRIEVTARMELAPRSMASCWLIGRDQRPQESAEICIFEIFGDAVGSCSAEVGAGLHAFRDPDVPEDFRTSHRDLDVARFHTYAVNWTHDEVTFFVDDLPLRSCANPPTYPMQAMLAVFDFPEKATDADHDHVPLLVVDRIRGDTPSRGGSRSTSTHLWDDPT